MVGKKGIIYQWKLYWPAIFLTMNLFFVPAVLPVMITHFLLCQLRANYSLKHRQTGQAGLTIVLLLSSQLFAVEIYNVYLVIIFSPISCVLGKLGLPSKEQFSKFHTFQKLEVKNPDRVSQFFYHKCSLPTRQDCCLIDFRDTSAGAHLPSSPY